MTKKRKRRKPEQIVKLLQEGDAMLVAGKSLGEVYQKLEVTKSTWQRWKKQYGGMDPEQVRSVRSCKMAEANILKCYKPTWSLNPSANVSS